MGWLSASGGLVYHLRARRYRDTLWKPFREALERELSPRLPETHALALVGPSGAHCLPVRALARYERLFAFETDPIARWLLRRKFGPSIEFVSTDALVAPLLQNRPGLAEWLDERPGMPVLFCNVLGQIRFELEEADLPRFSAAFRERLVEGALARRAWLSLHDRWTSEEAPRLIASDEYGARPSDAELARDWFASSDGVPLELFDHGTADLFPAEMPRRYFAWHLAPAQYQTVELCGAGSASNATTSSL